MNEVGLLCVIRHMQFYTPSPSMKSGKYEYNVYTINKLLHSQEHNQHAYSMYSDTTDQGLQSSTRRLNLGSGSKVR